MGFDTPEAGIQQPREWEMEMSNGLCQTNIGHSIPEAQGSLWPKSLPKLPMVAQTRAKVASNGVSG